MARSITVLPNTDAPDTDYPGGRLKDKVGSNPGTRVNEAMLGDMSQFFDKLMRETGAVYNNLPDNEYSGLQLYTALLNINGGLRRIVYEIGSWNMTADSSINVSTDVAYSKVRGVTATIISDIGGQTYNAGLVVSGSDSSGDLLINIIRDSFYTVGNGWQNGAINRGYLIVEYAP